MTIELDRIARVARAQLGEGLPRLVLRQAWAELRLAHRRGVRFRKSRNADAVSAYCAMDEREFSGINARQRWANWRVIPRSLFGRLPDGPVRALDLCSGLGDSTQVLAYYLPRGSEVLGLEYNPDFVAAASRRPYRDADGEPVRVAFRAQSVLDTFRDERGQALADGCVDLVNSCGSLGIHFDASGVDAIARETARVLRTGGLACVDSGRKGVRRDAMVRIFEGRGFAPLGGVKSCFLDRFTHVAFRKVRPDGPGASSPSRGSRRDGAAW